LSQNLGQPCGFRARPRPASTDLVWPLRCVWGLQHSPGKHRRFPPRASRKCRSKRTRAVICAQIGCPLLAPPRVRSPRAARRSTLGCGSARRWRTPRGSSVRAHPGRSSALHVFRSKSVLYGVFAWARGAHDRPKRRRFVARAVELSFIDGPVASTNGGSYDALGAFGAALPENIGVFRASARKMVPISPNASWPLTAQPFERAYFDRPLTNH
jgi:hypothetical protein